MDSYTPLKSLKNHWRKFVKMVREKCFQMVSLWKQRMCLKNLSNLFSKAECHLNLVKEEQKLSLKAKLSLERKEIVVILPQLLAKLLKKTVKTKRVEVKRSLKKVEGKSQSVKFQLKARKKMKRPKMFLPHKNPQSHQPMRKLYLKKSIQKMLKLSYHNQQNHQERRHRPKNLLKRKLDLRRILMLKRKFQWKVKPKRFPMEKLIQKR